MRSGLLAVLLLGACHQGARGDPCRSGLNCADGLVCVRGSDDPRDVDTCQVPCHLCDAFTDDGGCQFCLDFPLADPPYCVRTGCTE